MKILAHAKINLVLDILGKTASGYHKIQTIYQEIPQLKDEIEIFETNEKKNIFIIKNSLNFALNLKFPKDNLAFQALQLLKKTFKIKKFVKITIKKKIPYSAGLGGDSSDAAAVLKGLNKLWKLNLTTKKLLVLAEKLGMDVPFFIIGGTALGTNFGEKITALPPIKCVKFKICPPKEWPKLPQAIKSALKKQKNLPQKTKIINSQNLQRTTHNTNLQNKTALMYKSLNLSECGKNKHKTTLLIKAIKKQDNKAILQNLHNDFETLIKPKTNHCLSGSGPATFTLNR